MSNYDTLSRCIFETSLFIPPFPYLTGLENFNLEDLHELRHEEKEEVKKQIEAIYIEATSLEKKARELGMNCVFSFMPKPPQMS